MKPVAIEIATPCHESWNAMAPAEQGRFCQSCAKQVVDFSVMTDSEVLSYFSKDTIDTCGRFNTTQLQRTLQPAKATKNKARWVALIIPLLMLHHKTYARASPVVVNCPKPGAEKTGAFTNQHNIIRSNPAVYNNLFTMPGRPAPLANTGSIGEAKGNDTLLPGVLNGTENNMEDVAVKNYFTRRYLKLTVKKFTTASNYFMQKLRP